MNYEVFGIETDNNEKKFSDLFDEVYNDEGAFYESKETFKHEDEGLTFEYKFGVDICDIDAATGENTGEYGIELALVPTFKSLNEKKRKSLLDSFGLEEDEVQCINSREIHMDGLSVMFGYETIEHNGQPIDECETLHEKLNTIANVLGTMNSLRGFYLDRCQNRIGTTGWDLLHDFVDGKDFLKATLDRYKDEQ